MGLRRPVWWLGLVVITPAAGFVEPWAAVVMGLVVSPVCYFAVSFLKRKLGYDDGAPTHSASMPSAASRAAC